MTPRTRKPRRRIVRNLSAYKVGDTVRVSADYCGDYFGTVVRTYNALPLGNGADGAVVRAPGVTVKVTRWEGVDYNGHRGSAFAPFTIMAHDTDVSFNL